MMEYFRFSEAVRGHRYVCSNRICRLTESGIYLWSAIVVDHGTIIWYLVGGGWNIFKRGTLDFQKWDQKNGLLKWVNVVSINKSRTECHGYWTPLKTISFTMNMRRFCSTAEQVALCDLPYRPIRRSHILTSSIVVPVALPI